MKVYLVSGNPHKLLEIQKIAPEGVEIESIKSLGVSLDIDENGDTFIQNSVKKVEAFRKLGVPLIADDSGLEIDALDGFPGVHSARFMEEYSYEEKMQAILKKLANVENRTARFRCAATFLDPNNSILLAAEGTVEGLIALKIRGNKGFGYDPIFIPEGYGKTFGELGEEVKNQISHRSRAFKLLFGLLHLYILHKRI